MSNEQDHRPHWTLEGCLLFTLVLGPAIALGVAFDAKVGSISDWVAALATTGALVAAMIAARYAAGVLRIEQAREERVEKDRRAEQANRVAAWPDHVLYDLGDQDELSGEVTRTSVRGAIVMLRNMSDVPVTRLSLRLFVEHPDRDGTGLCVGQADLDLLPPTDEPIRVAVERGEDTPPVLVPPEVLRREFPMHVTIMFRDWQGRDWVRDHTSGLVLANGKA